MSESGEQPSLEGNQLPLKHLPLSRGPREGGMMGVPWGWCVVGGGGTGGCCNSLGEGRELAGEPGRRAGRAGGGSLWRLLRGWPEPDPRVWRAQS